MNRAAEFAGVHGNRIDRKGIQVESAYLLELPGEGSDHTLATVELGTDGDLVAVVNALTGV